MREGLRRHGGLKDGGNHREWISSNREQVRAFTANGYIAITSENRAVGMISEVLSMIARSLVKCAADKLMIGRDLRC